MELDDFGFTLLSSSSTTMALNSNDLFVLEVFPARPDDITIIFSVVDACGIGNGMRDKDPG